MITRRTAACIMAACLFGATHPMEAKAQTADYPNKPIRLIVPYPPGGFTDIVGRLLGDRLGSRLGQSIVVDNRAGAASTIGTNAVAKAPADGYTLLIVGPDIAINQTLLAGRITYDALRDFAPVTQLAASPTVMVVHPSFPVQSVSELVERAKSKPGTIRFASGGVGSGVHLTLELFKERAGINVLHVPYKGQGPLVTDLIAGHVDMAFMQVPVAQSHVAAGKLRAIATPSGSRLKVMPDIPTLSESGYPGFDVVPWFGLVAPAGTPSNLVARLNKEIQEVMNSPDVAKRLAGLGATVMTTTPDGFAKFIRLEAERWGTVIKNADISVQ